MLETELRSSARTVLALKHQVFSSTLSKANFKFFKNPTQTSGAPRHPSGCLSACATGGNTLLLQLFSTSVTSPDDTDPCCELPEDKGLLTCCYTHTWGTGQRVKGQRALPTRGLRQMPSCVTWNEAFVAGKGRAGFPLGWV